MLAQYEVLTRSLSMVKFVLLALLLMNLASRGRGRVFHFGGFDTYRASGQTSILNIVSGKIPSDLKGAFYVNGAGRNEVDGKGYGHWFDGDGLVTKIIVNGKEGTAEVLSRFIETTGYVEQEKRRTTFPLRRAWTLQGGDEGNFLSRLLSSTKFANPSNTNVIVHNDRLLALCEGGFPMELGKDSLETKTEYTFGGTLKSTFSAHPKIDPAVGTLYNIGYSLNTGPGDLAVIKCKNDGTVMSKIHRPPLPGLKLYHDMAISTKYLIVPVIPYGVINNPIALLKFVVGMASFGTEMRWHGDLPSYFMIFDRETLENVATVQVPTFSSYHTCNAYEQEDGTLSIYLAQHRGDREKLEAKFRDVFHSVYQPEDDCDVIRYDLSTRDWTFRTRTAVSSCALSMEFPVINPSYLGKPFQYYFSPALRQPGYFHVYQKVNVVTGNVLTYDLPEGVYGNECVFVPKASAGSNTVVSAPSDEDDGYLLACLYDGNVHGGGLLILDAKTMRQEALLSMPNPIPFHFHGTFVEDVV